MDWKIFEKINEFFYVTDIDSREIVYMNEASRRELKVEENYQGKKCFSILYGFATPCL